MTTQREAELESALIAQLQSMEWGLSSNGKEKMFCLKLCHSKV